jgi:hypothetical protein
MAFSTAIPVSSVQRLVFDDNKSRNGLSPTVRRRVLPYYSVRASLSVVPNSSSWLLRVAFLGAYIRNLMHHSQRTITGAGALANPTNRPVSVF